MRKMEEEGEEDEEGGRIRAKMIGEEEKSEEK